MFSFCKILWAARNASLYSSSAVLLASSSAPTQLLAHSLPLTSGTVGRARARVRRSVGWDKDTSEEGRWCKTIATAHRQIHAQPVPKQPPWKTTFSHLLLSSSTPAFYCWHIVVVTLYTVEYPSGWFWSAVPVPSLCLVGRKHPIILPEWEQLPGTYIVFVWVVPLLIGEHRHLFDSAVLFERIGFSRKWQDGLIIRRQTWETQLSQVVNEEIELCGNTPQTGFDQPRKRKHQNTQKWFCQCIRLKVKKNKPYFLLTKKRFLSDHWDI